MMGGLSSKVFFIQSPTTKHLTIDNSKYVGREEFCNTSTSSNLLLSWYFRTPTYYLHYFTTQLNIDVTLLAIIIIL